MAVKKALIVSYLWPPMEGVGLIRAMKFAKYLTGFGWQPFVLTVKPRINNKATGSVPPGVIVLRTDYRDVLHDAKKMFSHREDAGVTGSEGSEKRSSGMTKNRIGSIAREVVAMPDEQIGWYDFAVRDGKALIERERIDLIFSTSPPETAHLIARKLKKICGIPWVADLRDLWSDDHFRDRSFLKKAILKMMEGRVLKDADAVVTVSVPWASRLACSIGSRVDVIENGFDEEDFRGAVPVANKKFTITYTGKIHRKHQDISVFLKTIRDLVKSGDIDRGRVDVRFYALGYDRPDIDWMARIYGLEGIVRDMGRVSYEESIIEQKRSDALLFVQWQGRGREGWYSAKLYDYIGSRRPIIALAERGGIIEDIIRKTASGSIADDEKALKESLLRLYREYAASGTVKYCGNEAEVGKNTRRRRAGQLADIFDSLLPKNRAAAERVNTEVQ